MNKQTGYMPIVSLLFGIFLFFFSSCILAQQGKVYSLKIDGAISPASADYFTRGLDNAVSAKADILLLNMNTPGGLDKSMRSMIQAILSSPIPVVIYISPKGARAASAGTYLMYASHVAAMAPATNIGSATPVSIGMIKPPKPEAAEGEEATEKTKTPDTDSIMQKKMLNDAQAYIQSLAQLRGRNEQWAKEAVIEAANLSANDALDKKVIDIIAYDRNELIKQLHLREVIMGDRKITLQLVDPEVIEFKPDWRTEVLIVITDPNMAYLLLLAGIYGLMFEFLNPGSLLPGTVGVICLVVGLYALNMLPINMAGLTLLLIGISLMVAEAFAPSFGVLGLGGIMAFIAGSFMLMDSSLPGYQIAPALIISTAVASGFIAIMVLSILIKARHNPQVSGYHELIGHHAIAVDNFDISGNGRVMIRGEIWQADGSKSISKSQKVLVKAVNGLRLKVIMED